MVDINVIAFVKRISQDLFDTEMVYLLSGISRILNKNIMVGDVHQDDHHKNLNRILQRMLVQNLTVRREKYKYCKTNVGIPWHLFMAAKGLKQSANNLRAVNACKSQSATDTDIYIYIYIYIYKHQSTETPVVY